MWLTTSNTLGIGTSNTYGAKLAVLGGTLNNSSAGLAISSQLSAGRLTSGDTNNSTAYIGQFLDQSITEVSAGSSGALTSGIVAFGGSAAVNPNTVRTYTGGAVRTEVSSTGLAVTGTGSYTGLLYLGGSAGTVAERLQVNRGTDDATQSSFLGYTSLTLERTGVALSSVGSFNFNVRGTTTVTPLSFDYRSVTVASGTTQDASLTVKALTTNYASIINIEAQNDNGAIYNYIASNTTGVTQHWKISGGAATNTMALSTGGTERVRIQSTGLLQALFGSYSETSLGSVVGSQGFQIQQIATFNDNVAHNLSPFQDVAGILYIKDVGLSAIPFYPNGGGGVAYGWTILNPQTGVWSCAQGPVVNFTGFSASPNSYTVAFNGGSGTVTVTRTGGTTPYSVAAQRFGTT
jgi:hypothetical protein